MQYASKYVPFRMFTISSDKVIKLHEGNLLDQIHTKSKTIGVINALQKGEDFLVGHTYFVTQFSKLFFLVS